MLIQQTENSSKGSFFIEENGERLAEMTYSMAGANLMIIDHTEVDDRLRGKNIGLQLVQQAVAFARLHQLKIMPLCPFAKAVMEKKKDDFKDVLRS
ncbi:MAG: GNAT family N-acetyltransferase [Ferruginibacter sp.]